MTFKRSDAGLSNQHQFYNVEIVMFVEGGRRSFSLEELGAAVMLSGTGPDVAFWAAILRYFKYPKAVKIISVGSKPTLLKISLGIVEGRIKNVHVGMDRDFDTLTATSPVHSGIMYTYGYSWENDAWHPNVVLRIFGMLCPHHTLTAEIRDEFERCLDRFRRTLGRLVRLDAAMALMGRERGAFQTPGKLLEDRQGWPRCARSTVAQCTVRYWRAYKQHGGVEIPMIVVERDCSGDMVAAFAYRLLRALIRRVGESPSISREMANGLAISCFEQSLADDASTISTHYARQVRAATA